MTSFSGKFNLLKFKNSCIVSVKGKSETKRGVFIPIDDNNLFISADEDLKPKGAYFDFNAWKTSSPENTETPTASASRSPRRYVTA